MKNIKRLIILFLLLPALSIAQEEKINFTHKLNYELNDGNTKENISLYFSPNGSVIESDSQQRREKMLLKDQLFLLINIGLDGTASFPDSNGLANTIPSFTVLKTDKKDKINGISCNYYNVLVENENEEQIEMCISENNLIDMFATLPIKNIKGLIVKISDKDGFNLKLKSITKTNSSISIDWQETLARVKEELKGKKAFVVDTIAIPYDGYSEDSIAVGPTYDDERLYIIPSPYNSEYKTSKPENINLAIDQLKKNSPYWEGLPMYCKELDQNVSVFKNSSLKVHARNYAGQLCDMYFSHIKEYSVDVKGTLDQIRYEENYFRNTVFDKKDRKLLDGFLNNLD